MNRSLEQNANMVNAMVIAKERGLAITESYESRATSSDSILLELETERGTTTVEGTLVLGKPRLIQAEGITCEAGLAGHIVFMKNSDVPGVIGHVGTVLGRNSINIANFALGRNEGDAGERHAIALVETDQKVPESVLAELKTHKAVLVARTVEFPA